MFEFMVPIITFQIRFFCQYHRSIKVSWLQPISFYFGIGLFWIFLVLLLEFAIFLLRTFYITAIFKV